MSIKQVYKTLPDDRPITNINIIEDPDKCPKGFVVVHRTLDQDSDADLWREASFFGRKMTRYVCLSKTEGITDYIVENVSILNEKEVPPDGYTLLTRTADTEQKAWRKRQLCYRLSKRSLAAFVVTDIIILSRLKKAPDGFSLAGDINGMTVCFKVRPSQDINRPASVNTPLMYSLTPQLPYQASPQSPYQQAPHRPAPQPMLPYQQPQQQPPSPVVPFQQQRVSMPTSPLQPYSLPSSPVVKNGNSNGNGYPAVNGDSPTHTYERLIELKPSRPAPRPPETQITSYATTMSYHGYHELDGVPFILNSMLQKEGSSVPTIKPRTLSQLNQEYDYDFQAERQT